MPTAAKWAVKQGYIIGVRFDMLCFVLFCFALFCFALLCFALLWFGLVWPGRLGWRGGGVLCDCIFVIAGCNYSFVVYIICYQYKCLPSLRVRACVRACAYACVHVRVCVHVCVYAHTLICMSAVCIRS